MARHVGLNDPEMDREARQPESRSRLGADDSSAWRLAVVEGRLGDTGMAALALAEMNYAEDNWREARGQAERAKRLLASGTPGWLRASDLAEIAEREEEREEQRRRR